MAHQDRGEGKWSAWTKETLRELEAARRRAKTNRLKALKLIARIEKQRADAAALVERIRKTAQLADEPGDGSGEGGRS